MQTASLQILQKAPCGYDRYRQVLCYPAVLLLMVALLLVHPVCGFVTVEYFHHADCLNCLRTDPIIQDVKERYGDRVDVRDNSINTRESIRLLMSYGRT